MNISPNHVISEDDSQSAVSAKEESVLGAPPVPQRLHFLSENPQKQYSHDGDKFSSSRPAKKSRGKQKIRIEFMQEKNRRYSTFSKRKTGLMKKAFELAQLTKAEVLLLVASETSHVYTFATEKLKAMVESERGKALIQTCLCSIGGGGGGASGGASGTWSDQETGLGDDDDIAENEEDSPTIEERQREDESQVGKETDELNSDTQHFGDPGPLNMSLVNGVLQINPEIYSNLTAAHQQTTTLPQKRPHPPDNNEQHQTSAAPSTPIVLDLNTLAQLQCDPNSLQQFIAASLESLSKAGTSDVQPPS